MQYGDTSILVASDNGHRETVEVLLAHKGDVNVKNKVSRGEGAPMGDPLSLSLSLSFSLSHTHIHTHTNTHTHIRTHALRTTVTLALALTPQT